MGATRNGFEVNAKPGTWNPVNSASDLTTVGVCFNVKQPPQKGIYAFEFSLCRYPTANCQVTSLGRIDTLLTQVKNKEDMLEVLTEAYRIINMPMLFVVLDCKQNFCPELEKIFRTIVWKNMYTSANGSQMCMYMVDIRPNTWQ